MTQLRLASTTPLEQHVHRLLQAAQTQYTALHRTLYVPNTTIMTPKSAYRGVRLKTAVSKWCRRKMWHNTGRVGRDTVKGRSFVDIVPGTSLFLRAVSWRELMHCVEDVGLSVQVLCTSAARRALWTSIARIAPTAVTNRVTCTFFELGAPRARPLCGERRIWQPRWRDRRWWKT